MIWAEQIDLEGVPNLHRVSENLYRSAQPTTTGFHNLKKLGVFTVFNLRSFHHDPEIIGMKMLNIDCKAWHPEKEDVILFLKYVRNTVSPILIHCQHGADRTGVMCALYRTLRQGWDADEAVKELVHGGFGFHGIWFELAPFVRAMTEELKDANI